MTRTSRLVLFALCVMGAHIANGQTSDTTKTSRVSITPTDSAALACEDKTCYEENREAFLGLMAHYERAADDTIAANKRPEAATYYAGFGVGLGGGAIGLVSQTRVLTVIGGILGLLSTGIEKIRSDRAYSGKLALSGSCKNAVQQARNQYTIDYPRAVLPKTPAEWAAVHAEEQSLLQAVSAACGSKMT